MDGRSLLLVLSLGLNLALLLPSSGHWLAVINHGARDNHTQLTVVDRVAGELYSPQANKQRSSWFLNKAATYPAEKGEGNLGWLWLLAAVDVDRGNEVALKNLVSNYHRIFAGFSALAYSELSRATVSAAVKKALMSEEERSKQAKQFEGMAKRIAAAPALPAPCDYRAFATLFSYWDFDQGRAPWPASLNDAIYNASVTEYLNLKQLRPELDATALNHALFKAQMSKIETGSAFWGIFQDIEGMDALVMAMRRGSVDFLRNHGIADAVMRASHPLVVWVSVHTDESVHQPHVTTDAMVGGVYYVRTPRNAGRLVMYDPRGKHPVTGLVNPVSPPDPPFHRSLALYPRESRLVLFPGSLVHSVLSSDKPMEPKGTYRVSLSLNLKGEWQETAALSWKQGAGCAAN